MAKHTKDASIWYILDGRNNTVGDLREFIEEINLLGVPDNYKLEDCIVTFHYQGDVELIIDGEYAPYVDKYDILVKLDFNNEKNADKDNSS